MKETKDFLRRIVEEDLASGACRQVVTRFPPEPNGFPHIGHAKSISINFGIARDYGGQCHLRMDDTNPTTEDPRYVQALKDAVEWLGYTWEGEVRYTSDYFEQLYAYACTLIRQGKAYVDSLDEEAMRAHRGTVTEPGRRSVYAERSVEENLDLFARMRRGEFAEGTHVLRARIDMASPNMKMRDPLLYRIRHAHHYRTGDAWAIYPMYDFAHCLSDYIEGISHSLCTLEFENNREVYDWILDALELEPPRPHQYEFARLNITYTVMSKRKLLELVETGKVSGWDDPRMPTLAGYRRRGYTPASILSFCDQIGISKANSTVDVAQLEHAIRDDLNPQAPRVMCVLDPLKVTIVNYDGIEEITAPYFPDDIGREGSRVLPFGREIYIDREDFAEHPPKGYYRLTPDQPVRLKHAYIIEYEEAIRDADGRIVELRVRYHPDSRSGSDTSGIRVRSAIQWVEAVTARPVTARLYDRLYRVEAPEGLEDLNPDSLTIVSDALVEPSVCAEGAAERFQFERLGYFYRDPIDSTPEHPVFNRIVTLKDSWAKKRHPAPATKPDPKPRPKQIDGAEAPMSPQEQARFDHATATLRLNHALANTLARDARLWEIFEAGIATGAQPATLAALITGEVARTLKHAPQTSIDPTHIAALARLIEEETVSTKAAKEVFGIMIQTGQEPAQIVQERGLEQINDPEALRALLESIIARHPDKARQVRDGQTKLMGFFVGQALRASNDRANPALLRTLLPDLLR